MTALRVANGPKTDSTGGAFQQAVIVLFMHLRILTNLNLRMFVKIKVAVIHDIEWGTG